MGNAKKMASQLGMSHGAASSRLRKLLLFDFSKRLGLDVCVRCGVVIENLDEFSIEHVTPWLNSDDPVKLFFDLGNIRFSHLKCNMRENRGLYTSDDNPISWTRDTCQRGHKLTPNNVYTSPVGRNRCRECKRERDRLEDSAR